MKKLTLSLTIALSTAAHAHQPINAPFGRTEDVTSVTMILTQSELSGGQPLTESQLTDVGCTFQVNDPTLIGEIFKIIHPAKFGFGARPARVRHALYLWMKGQAEPGAKYLMAERQGPDGTVGSIDAPAIRSETLYFTTKPDVPDLLRTWARTHITQLSVIPPRSDPSNPCTFLPLLKCDLRIPPAVNNLKAMQSHGTAEISPFSRLWLMVGGRRRSAVPLRKWA